MKNLIDLYEASILDMDDILAVDKKSDIERARETFCNRKNYVAYKTKWGNTYYKIPDNGDHVLDFPLLLFDVLPKDSDCVVMELCINYLADRNEDQITWEAWFQFRSRRPSGIREIKYGTAPIELEVNQENGKTLDAFLNKIIKPLLKDNKTFKDFITPRLEKA